MGRKTECMNCKSIFVDSLEGATEGENEKEENEKELFLDIANRGGLTKPSDMLYSACLLSWALYAKIKENDELFKLLISQSPIRLYHLLSRQDSNKRVFFPSHYDLCDRLQ